MMLRKLTIIKAITIVFCSRSVTAIRWLELFRVTREICVDENVENSDHFSWFLKTLGICIDLIVKVGPFYQSFYNKLGELDQIFDLPVGDRSVTLMTSLKLNFNLDFLLS